MIPIEQINIDIKKDNIIEGIMKSNGLYCLVAEPKVSKSFLALQIANSLTNNKEFLGFKVNPTPILYISTELSSLQLKERLTEKKSKFFSVVNIIELQNSKLNNNVIETRPTILLEHKETHDPEEELYDYEEYEIVRSKDKDDLVL